MDVTPLVYAWMIDDVPNLGLRLSASGRLDSGDPIIGTAFTVASSESDRAPVLRIEQVALGEFTVTPTTPPTKSTSTGTPEVRWRGWLPVAASGK
jgi:hypothetical protein